MTTNELLSKLASKYAAPQYAFLTQVRNQTGFSNGSIRTADALAMSLWPSRGHYLIGFELKVSRSDWLHELKDPSKAEAIVKYCDMFYLVISELSIIDISEVPNTWGVLVYGKGRLRTLREAPILSPEPISRAFLSGVMRNISESITKDYIKKSDIESIIEARINEGINRYVNASDEIIKEYHYLVENLKQFKEASGLDLTRLKYNWESPLDLGLAVKAVLNGDYKRIKERLEFLGDTIDHIKGDLQKRLKELDSIE